MNLFRGSRELLALQIRIVSKSGFNSCSTPPDPGSAAYIQQCFYLHADTGYGLILTRDNPPDGASWRKCWHLAVFRIGPDGARQDPDPKIASGWSALIVGHRLPDVRRVFISQDPARKRMEYHYVLQVADWSQEDPMVVTPGSPGSILPRVAPKDRIN